MDLPPARNLITFAKNEAMSSYVLKVNEKKSSGKKLIDYLKSLSETSADIELVPQDESPYNKEFVKKIQASRKSKGKAIQLEDLWK